MCLIYCDEIHSAAGLFSFLQFRTSYGCHGTLRNNRVENIYCCYIYYQEE